MVDDHRHEAKINFGRAASQLGGPEASERSHLFRQALNSKVFRKMKKLPIYELMIWHIKVQLLLVHVYSSVSLDFNVIPFFHCVSDFFEFVSVCQWLILFLWSLMLASIFVSRILHFYKRRSNQSNPTLTVEFFAKFSNLCYIFNACFQLLRFCCHDFANKFWNKNFLFSLAN